MAINTSVHEPITLLASSARTDATGNGDAQFHPAWGAMVLQLDVTALATAAGDKLDVAVQTQLDDSNWIDIVAFDQVLGNGTAVTYVYKIAAGAAESGFETGATLSAGSTRNLLGRRIRARWAITNAGAAGFTFSVIAVPM